MGIGIIDTRIKELRKISKTICKEMRGTAFEEYGKAVNKVSGLLDVRDPTGLKKGVDHMRFILADIFSKLPREHCEGVLETFKMIDEEADYGDKINLMNDLLSRLRGIPYVQIKILGNDNKVNIGSTDRSYNVINCASPDNK